jgi:hypothetical protein
MQAPRVDVTIDSGVRVVVIPVGVSLYHNPPDAQIKRGRRRFQNLESVENDLAQLALLYESEPYRQNGFFVHPVISGTAGEITDRLNEIAQQLAAKPARTVLLFWSGHGDAPNGGELRLATSECCHPMTPGDGVSPSELIKKLAASGAYCFCLVLDVCQAGAAGGAVAVAAAERFRDNADGGFKGMAALFSAQAFELAEEGLFAAVLQRVLRTGPSAEARVRIDEQGFGGFTFNRLLTMDELENVIKVEFELLQKHKPTVQAPVGQRIGSPFGLFPNPLYRRDAPPLGVEVSRRRWLRQEDLDTHFLPKARGLEPGEEGWFFAGRQAVTREILDWLDERGPAAAEFRYVLTGSGGTGKSAILGRIVALSDPYFRTSVMGAHAVADANDTVPDIGSVDAAIHLRKFDVGATVATLSELLGLSSPDTASVHAWIDAQPARLPGRARAVTVVLDALDEAADPAGIIDRLIQPLGTRGWRFLIGSRASAGSHQAASLVNRLKPAYFRDLDAEVTAERDIVDYVRRRLTQTPDSSYAGIPEDPEIIAIAGKIASKANGRFLFARLAVSGLLRRRQRISPSELEAATGDTVGEAVARDLVSTDDGFRAKFSRSDAGASTILAALAWAEGDGLPLRDGIWRTVASALQSDVPPLEDEHVRWVLQDAGRYIIESGDGEQAVYRLFHESLNEHFRAGLDQDKMRTRIASALVREVDERGGWDMANPHLVQYLPFYYGRDAGLSRLCTNPWYLRRALELLGPDRLADILTRVYRRYRASPIDAVAKSIQRARVALSRDPGQFAAQLHARLAGEETGEVKALIFNLPRVAPPFWLRSRGVTLGWHASLETMQTFGAKVRALAFGYIEGDGVLAVGVGTEVILWNPRTGALPTRSIDNDGLRVTGLAIGLVGDREAIATAAGYDGRLTIRDWRTGVQIGEPMVCGTGTVALGRIAGRDVVAISDGSGCVVRTIGGEHPAWEKRFGVNEVGQLGGEVVAIEHSNNRRRVIKLDTGEQIGQEFELPETVTRMAVGEFKRDPVLCHSDITGTVGVVNLSTDERLAEGIAMQFPIRTLAVGEIDGECIVVAGNDTDFEGGFVAIRQPLTVEAQSRPIEGDLAGRRILGVGLATQTAKPARTLALVFEGIGAVDPLTGKILSNGPETESIEHFNGAWQVPSAIAEQTEIIPGGHGRGRGFILRRDRPLQWPITCEAWATIGGRLLHARGSYFGTAWVIDARQGEVLAGPFRSVENEVRFWHTKHEPGPEDPATGVALGEWQNQAVIAIAHIGRAEVFDLASAQLICSPKTRRSQIVAVAVGQSNDRALLVTASAGGAVTVWEGPSMRRLASITLDVGCRGVWLAADVVAVRTADGRFHVFDLMCKSTPR